MEWWINFDGEVSDEPYTREEIRDHAGVGPDTKVCRKGEEEWVPASEVPELQSLFAEGRDASSSADGMENLEEKLRNEEGSPAGGTSEGWADWFQSLPGVFKKIVLAPGDFFASQRTLSVGFSIFYAIVLNMIVQVSAILYASIGMTNALRNIENKEELPWVMAHPELFMLLIVLLLPIFVPIFLYVGGGILHLILKLFGWNDGSYTETVKMVGFLSTSYAANIVPFIGGILGFFWGIFLEVVGLKKVHNLSTGQAIFVVVLPFLLIFGFIFVIAFFVALGPMFLPLT